MMHQVRDGATRRIEFEGDLLASYSSRRNQGPRWTDLRLYKTVGGEYILEKIGASVVVHSPRCTEPKGPLPRFQEVHPGEDPVDGNWWFCEVCGNEAVRDITSLLVETDRFWATRSADPSQIVDALYRRRNGAKSMPRMALDLLEEAGHSDQAILDSFRSEFVP